MAEYIKKVDESTRQSIKNKSAFSLPTRPSEAGMKADSIKRTFYQPIVDMTQSALGEIDRVADETNAALNEISAEVLQNAKEYTDTKINNFQIFEIVNQLPATGDKNKLYLLIKDGVEGDLYGEYLYTDSGWEFIGEVSVKSGTIVYVNGVQQSVLYFSRNPQEEIDSINEDIQGISTNLQNATDDIQNISADLQDTLERLTKTENDIVGLNTEIANKTVVKVGGVAQSEVDFTRNPQTQLDEKATKTELTAGLAGKQPVGDYATIEELKSIDTQEIVYDKDSSDPAINLGYPNGILAGAEAITSINFSKYKYVIVECLMSTIATAQCYVGKLQGAVSLSGSYIGFMTIDIKTQYLKVTNAKEVYLYGTHQFSWYDKAGSYYISKITGVLKYEDSNTEQ